MQTNIPQHTLTRISDKLPTLKFSPCYDQLCCDAIVSVERFQNGGHASDILEAICQLVILHNLVSTNAGLDDRPSTATIEPATGLDWSGVPK